MKFPKADINPNIKFVLSKYLLNEYFAYNWLIEPFAVLFKKENTTTTLIMSQGETLANKILCPHSLIMKADS